VFLHCAVVKCINDSEDSAVSIFRVTELIWAEVSVMTILSVILVDWR